MVLWAACFPLINLALDDAPHFTFALLRAMLSGCLLLAVALVLKRAIPKKLRVWLILLGIGLGATTLGFMGMIHAAEFVAPGLATVITSAQPLLAAVLAHFALRERLGRRAKFGLALGFVGIVLIVYPKLIGPGADVFLTGILYILLSAIGITFSNVLIKLLGDEVDPLVSMGIQLVLGGLLLGVLVAALEPQEQISWTPQFIFSLLGLSAFGTALAYWLWCRVLIRVDLSRANVFSFLVPVFGLAMGVLLYGEHITAPVFVGTGAILTGIILVIRDTGNVSS